MHMCCRDSCGANRYISLDFTAPIGVMLHGFGGYFEAWLYKDITISTCWGGASHRLVLLARGAARFAFCESECYRVLPWPVAVTRH